MVIVKMNTKEPFSWKISKSLDYPVFFIKTALAKFHVYRHLTHFVTLGHVYIYIYIYNYIYICGVYMK